MGIPFYFKTIVSNYPEVVRGCSKTRKFNCNRLYLDFNCVMHMTAARLLPLASADESPLSFAEKVMRNSLEYIHVILEVAYPSDLLFIAIDGTCPRAKMHQQRKRRYMSVWRTAELEKHGIQTSALWDSNVITPGTKFMQTFDTMITEYQDVLKKKTNIANVIISTSSQFGEGEHKIYNHLDTVRHDTNSTKNIIYGLDADLILLSLLNSTSSTSIDLVRETPEFGNKICEDAFLRLDIAILKDALLQHHFSEVRQLLSDDELVKDYVMLCSLIGNDFLPPLSYLKIKYNGIDIIMKTYKKTLSLLNRPLCTNGFDFAFFTQMSSELSKNEDECIMEVSKSYYERKVFTPNSKTTKEIVEWKLDNYPTLNKYPRVVDVCSKGWRLSYYKHLFGDSSHVMINQICQNYVEGLLWNYEYYFTRQQNDGWYYKYNYAPSILDINRYISTLDNTNMSDLRFGNDDETHKRFHQMINSDIHLLMVLPPQSVSLLQQKYHQLMHSLSHGLVHCYPHSFTITTYLKNYLWECCIALPDIDMDELSKLYTALSQTQ